MSELNQNQSFNYSSFSEFCFHKNELSSETRHTVEVLLDVAGTDDYLEAERVLLKWLLEEKNTELRRILIETIGYNRICEELQATQLDSFREYDLIKIDAEADVEPIVLLKMICPSTGYTHVLRVPPNMESAREAITWINWDIDPQEFAIES
jgi:internalin A